MRDSAGYISAMVFKNQKPTATQRWGQADYRVVGRDRRWLPGPRYASCPRICRAQWPFGRARVLHRVDSWNPNPCEAWFRATGWRFFYGAKLLSSYIHFSFGPQAIPVAWTEVHEIPDDWSSCRGAPFFESELNAFLVEVQKYSYSALVAFW